VTEESQAELQTPPRFVFVRELGRGILGEVYEVIDEVRGEPVVLKVFLRARPRDPDRFKLDFESLTRLDHPSLVTYHHLVDPLGDTNVAVQEKVGQAGLAFTQEYVDGVDLLTWLRRPPTEDETTTLETRRTSTTGELDVPTPTGELSGEESETELVDTGANAISTGEFAGTLDDAASIVEELAAVSEAVDAPPLDLILLRLEYIVPQIAEGLQYLHRFQRVHGLLRPSNVLVTRDGDCKLTDYGIVTGLVYRAPGDEGSEPVSLLKAPEHLPYVAPEITDEATHAGDLYALGCILFEAVAGYSPFEALEFTGGRKRKLEVPPLAELVPECPASWAERIDGLLRSDPEERPSLGTIVEVMGGTEGRAVQLPPTVIPEPDTFVGQRSTLQLLRETAREVSEEHHMRLTLLEGDSGSGKSTIVEEVAHWLSRRGWLVISGQCFNRESVPYQGWHQIARRISQMCDALPPTLQETVAADRRVASILFPVLSPVPEPPEFEQPIGRLAAIRALRRLIGTLAAQRPILLCIEDLHWASWDTSSLLLDLFSESAEMSCLVIGTWRSDTRRSDDHFLRRDLELSLIDVQRIPVTGFTGDEAREYLVTRAPDAPLDDLRTIIRTGRSNPRLLDELLWEMKQGRLDEIDVESRDDLLQRLYRNRMTELDKRHQATLNILAVASGPLAQDWLARAVEAELSGSVLPAEQTRESIEDAFEEMARRRLIRQRTDTEGRPEWVIAHDVCRDVVTENLSDRDRARLAGRVADAVGDDDPDRHDLRFEYELRAGRVANAIKAAVRAARSAERRFAYHRSAKLWRWLLDNQEKLDDPTVDPGVELARVEHLAGQHAEAAELYAEWAERTSDRVRRARIRRDEAAARLQAGDVDSALEALEAAFAQFGETYVGRWHSMVSETPGRWVATLSRWNQRLVETCEVDSAEPRDRMRGELYDFALEKNAWLLSDRAPEVEARLARLASKTRDARLLGIHRMRLAILHAGMGVESRRERAMSWLEEAEKAFARVDDVGCSAQLHLHRAVLNIRYGEFEVARASLDEVIALNQRAEDEQQSDRRASLYWRAVFHLYTGELDRAEFIARQLLHTYRGDRLAASIAYRVLARIALNRGDTPLAEAFVDAGSTNMTSSRPNFAAMLWQRESTRLHVARGRPEVAVGQLDVVLETLDEAGLAGPSFEILAQLCMGQAAAALAERQRLLGEPRQDETLARLRRSQKRLEANLDAMNAIRQAECHRLFARIALLVGKPRKALRYAEAAIEALGGIQAPIHIAKCTEAHGVVLYRLERPQARGIIDQARELYRHCGASYPLVLEGWPVPRDASMLKQD
jgi:serine/threonine protein kinase/tetratricopeptide (TPR) repeat protein